MFPILIAQAAGGLAGVPADFVKYFVITAAFFAGIWFSYRRGKMQSGSKEEPLHVAQPVAVNVEGNMVVKPVPEWASKSEMAKELESLEARMESMARENLRQHNDTAKRLNDSLQAGVERETKFLAAIYEVGGDIHERLNPVAESCKAQSAQLEQHNQRLSSMERQHSDAFARLHARIDDAIRTRKS